MLSAKEYVALCFILFTIFGIIGYHFDRRYGTKIYRIWYNWTNKNPLPENVELGFIHNQSTKKKVAILTTISTIQSFLMIWKADVNPLGELAMLFAEIPFAMLGFYLGPKIFPIWNKKDEFFDAFDKG